MAPTDGIEGAASPSPGELEDAQAVESKLLRTQLVGQPEGPQRVESSTASTFAWGVSKEARDAPTKSTGLATVVAVQEKEKNSDPSFKSRRGKSCTLQASILTL